MRNRIATIYFSSSREVAGLLAALLAKEGVEARITPDGCCNGLLTKGMSLEGWLDVADLAARTGEVKLYRPDGREICCLPLDVSEVQRLFPEKSEREITNAMCDMKFARGTLKLLKPKNIIGMGTHL